jgi:hypothetical protein
MLKVGLDGSIEEVPDQRGLIFENAEGVQTAVVVFDRKPANQEDYREGDRYVEVSVELFVQIMSANGWEIRYPETPQPTDEELWNALQADLNENEGEDA